MLVLFSYFLILFNVKSTINFNKAIQTNIKAEINLLFKETN
jgi:hypothetical protein